MGFFEKENPSAIREMVLSDCAEVAKIESSSFSDPWPLESFAAILGQTDTVAFVYAPEDQVLAYLILKLGAPEAHILNIAVHPGHRRRGIGLECLRHVERCLRRKGVNQVVLEVQESNLGAQLLYRKAGYRATRILRNHYPAIQEDGYRMVRVLEEPAPTTP